MSAMPKFSTPPAPILDRITPDHLAKFDEGRRAALHLRHLEQCLREQEEGHARRRAKLLQEINVQRGIAEAGLAQTADILAGILARKAGA